MSIRSVDGRWGKIFYEGKDEYVGKSLHNYGEYNPDETEMILSLAKDTCLDIGANFGVMAQALEHEGFKVIAFEPQPYVYSILQKNVNGQCYNTALGDKLDIAKMPRLDNGSRYNYGGMGIGMIGDRGTIDVEVIPLDMLNIPNVGFMKIDVEGFEEKVLRGAVETISRCKPIMYIEDDRVENSASLRKYIEYLGYTWENHDPSLYRENNFFGLKKNIWGINYVSHNLICRPK